MLSNLHCIVINIPEEKIGRKNRRNLISILVVAGGKMPSNKYNNVLKCYRETHKEYKELHDFFCQDTATLRRMLLRMFPASYQKCDSERDRLNQSTNLGSGSVRNVPAVRPGLPNGP
jgi:hypothetical protein